ncbi:MAG: TIGR03546 family protein [Novipirellula sp. JB048]
MIIWSIKILSHIRQAIAGRRYPHQLAWAVALGTLLGIIPHGNLLALLLLLILMSLKINHSMAAVTAVGISFAASRLDPYSHQVGNAILTHPTLGPKMASFWKLPLVPWTDLNNTVVMGSFVIGVAAMVPIFLLTYPLFRLFKPQQEESPQQVSPQQVSPQEQVDADRRSDSRSDSALDVKPDAALVTVSPGVTPWLGGDSDRRAESSLESGRSGSGEVGSPAIAVETRIDVIRIQDPAAGGGSQSTRPAADADEETTDPEPMDEALNYLLRQLRSTQQKDAA